MVEEVDERNLTEYGLTPLHDNIESNESAITEMVKVVADADRNLDKQRTCLPTAPPASVGEGEGDFLVKGIVLKSPGGTRSAKFKINPTGLTVDRGLESITLSDSKGDFTAAGIFKARR